MIDERKEQTLKLLTLDYFLMDRIREILNQNLDDYVKANLLCDVVKDEVERHISEAYDKGYEVGFENGNDDTGIEDLKEALEDIIHTARMAL